MYVWAGDGINQNEAEKETEEVVKKEESIEETESESDGGDDDVVTTDVEEKGGLKDNKLRPIESTDQLMPSPFALFGGSTIYEVKHTIRRRGSSFVGKRDFYKFELLAKCESPKLYSFGFSLFFTRIIVVISDNLSGKKLNMIATHAKHSNRIN